MKTNKYWRRYDRASKIRVTSARTIDGPSLLAEPHSAEGRPSYQHDDPRTTYDTIIVQTNFLLLFLYVFCLCHPPLTATIVIFIGEAKGGGHFTRSTNCPSHRGGGGLLENTVSRPDGGCPFLRSERTAAIKWYLIIVRSSGARICWMVAALKGI